MFCDVSAMYGKRLTVDLPLRRSSMDDRLLRQVAMIDTLRAVEAVKHNSDLERKRFSSEHHSVNSEIRCEPEDWRRTRSVSMCLNVDSMTDHRQFPVGSRRASCNTHRAYMDYRRTGILDNRRWSVDNRCGPGSGEHHNQRCIEHPHTVSCQDCRRTSADYRRISGSGVNGFEHRILRSDYRQSLSCQDCRRLSVEHRRVSTDFIRSISTVDCRRYSGNLDYRSSSGALEFRRASASYEYARSLSSIDCRRLSGHLSDSRRSSGGPDNRRSSIADWRRRGIIEQELLNAPQVRVFGLVRRSGKIYIRILL